MLNNSKHVLFSALIRAAASAWRRARDQTPAYWSEGLTILLGKVLHKIVDHFYSNLYFATIYIYIYIYIYNI